jgi:hypothetical protein
MNDIFATDDGGTNTAGRLATAALTRRGVLAGLAASPVLVALGTGTSVAGTRAPLAGIAAAKPTLVRGGAHQYHWPQIQPGYRIRMPQGVEVISHRVLNDTASRRMAGGGGSYSWPLVPQMGGGKVDLSIVPKPGEPSNEAYLTGFDKGWYDITDTQGHVISRVEWNARKMKFLRIWQEWGASQSYPFFSSFFTLGLEPFSSIPTSS